MDDASAAYGLVGRCPQMQRLRAQVARLAKSDLRVHVLGETGTGKECVARALHAGSRRAGRALVALNAAAFADDLFEAELFGHARGAFTGAAMAREGYVAAAEGGTLFIDEISELTPRAQARLLRFLQEREYRRLGETVLRRADVRVLSATNADLERRVAEGRFRADLWFRLKEERLFLPPLRDRGPDVTLLARHFLAREATAQQRRPPVLGLAAHRLLRRYDWPGNVRELEGEMRRLAVVAEGLRVGPEHLSPEIRTRARGQGSVDAGLKGVLRAFERECLEDALARNGGARARTAAALGITRQALHGKMRRHGLLFLRRG
jgi:DNA-binding NtrC family response regulator